MDYKRSYHRAGPSLVNVFPRRPPVKRRRALSTPACFRAKGGQVQKFVPHPFVGALVCRPPGGAQARRQHFAVRGGSFQTSVHDEHGREAVIVGIGGGKQCIPRVRPADVGRAAADILLVFGKALSLRQRVQRVFMAVSVVTKSRQKGPALKGAFCAPCGSSSLQYRSGVLLLRLSPQSIAKCALSGCEAIASG